MATPTSNDGGWSLVFHKQVTGHKSCTHGRVRGVKNNNDDHYID